MAGRISDQDMEELRRKASLADVAADYMRLRKSGPRLVARCPFHSEKTPSFTIDPAKNLYHCFGCSKGGDVFSLLMELEGLSFIEAAERLAGRFGVEIHYEQMSASERAASGRRGRLIEAHREAVAHYQRALFAPEGTEVREYLKGRGFSKQTVDDFQLGFSPRRRDDLARHLLRKGFREDELVEAGLALRSDAGPLIDRFRGRVMFPIHDLTGNPVGFGARRLADAGDGPKYLNSAESPIYKKGSVLYALDRAKAEIVRSGRVIIVEGYTDVMALHQAGVREAIATCGTAFAADHFGVLRRFTDVAVFAFDSDEAGQAAADRSFEQVQESEVDARILVVPQGKDPAEFVADQGGEAFRALAEGAEPLFRYRLEREIVKFVPRGADPAQAISPERRPKAVLAAIPILLRIRREDVRNAYASHLAQRLAIDPAVVFHELAQVSASRRVDVRASERRLTPQARKEREAIKIALQYPDMARPYFDELGEDDFSVPAHRVTWAAIRKGIRDPNVIASSAPDARTREVITALHVEAPEGVEPGAESISQRLAEEIFSRMKEFAIARKIEQARGELQRMNPEKDRATYDAKFRELVALEGSKRRMAVALQEGTA